MKKVMTTDGNYAFIEEVIEPAKELNKLTKKELMKIADELKIKYPKEVTNSMLVQLIEEADHE